jgi:NTE family protein
VAPLGLALGSGGARGWCHIGVLNRLGELGIEPDMIAGCSMGALVGAAFAAGRLGELEAWARSLTIPKYVSLLDLRPTGGGLVAGRAIAKLLAEIGLPDRIEDLPMPFAAVATDMETGREIWLREGPLAEAVRASVAIPGVLSPYRIGKRWMLDGGLTDPVPVSLARALGAEIVIASNPNAKLDGLLWRADHGGAASWRSLLAALPDRLREAVQPLVPGTSEAESAPTYIDVLATAIDVMSEQIVRSRLAGDPPQVLLSANLSRITILDLHRAVEAIEEGRRMVDAQATHLKALLNG